MPKYYAMPCDVAIEADSQAEANQRWEQFRAAAVLLMDHVTIDGIQDEPSLDFDPEAKP